MKAQAEIVGFILLTLIVLAVVSISFFWAKPKIDQINNINEISRVENRMIALHNAIKDVANEQSQRTVSFEIKKGSLYSDGNRTIVYSAYMDLPEKFISDRKMLAGNASLQDSSQGPCLNTSIYGRLGKDDPGCLTEKGTIEIELKYINMNDTSANKCYGIWLDAGENVMAGPGEHTVLITFKETNTTTIGSCDDSTRQVVTVDMR